MRIAQVAPMYEAVPPRLYGGTERVVSWLTEELARRGHDVTLFASGDSRTRARLVSAHPRALRLDPAPPDPLSVHVLELAEVFERAREFDVIHCHVDYLAFPFGRLVATPVVHTTHGRLDLRDLVPVFRRFADVPLVSISEAQREPLRAVRPNWVATVYHGLPADDIPFDPDGGGGGYLVFLGRLSREKRPDIAIAVARRLGMPLKIAAKVDEADREYFDHEIRPLLRDPLIEYLGEVGDGDKWRLLTDAHCLLFPIDWPEPFGLAVIEALACGTPVVARGCGSIPELIEDGRTGFIADTVDELAAAVKRVDVLDRRRCRRSVEERFSVQVMADRYEAVYRRLQG
jgi:glycosyltransferase involved in cell wall biosynthesis